MVQISNFELTHGVLPKFLKSSDNGKKFAVINFIIPLSGVEHQWR